MLLLVYLLLTCMVMFYKADFVNQTIGVTALYMMLHTETVTRTKFRFLVLGIFISIIYDIVWFYLKHAELTDDSKKAGDGGQEKGVRTFALAIAYLSFALRVSFLRLTRFLVRPSSCVLEGF